MYCNKCGKHIESGIICPECAIAEYEKNSTNKVAPIKEDSTSFNYIPFPEPNNRMYGFGIALTAQILAIIGVFVSYFAVLANILISTVTGVILGFISLLFVFIPLFLAIESIQTFKKRKHPCKRPIATLILGISTLETIPLAAIYTLVAFGLSSVL